MLDTETLSATTDSDNVEPEQYGKIVDGIKKSKTKYGDQYDILITVDANNKERFLNARTTNLTFRSYNYKDAVEKRDLIRKALSTVKPRRKCVSPARTREECAQEYAKAYLKNINDVMNTNFCFSPADYSETVYKAVKAYTYMVFTEEIEVNGNQQKTDRELLRSVLKHYRLEKSPFEKTYDSLRYAFSFSAEYIKYQDPDFFKMYAQEAVDEKDQEKLLYVEHIVKRLDTPISA